MVFAEAAKLAASGVELGVAGAAATTADDGRSRGKSTNGLNCAECVSMGRPAV